MSTFTLVVKIDPEQVTLLKEVTGYRLCISKKVNGVYCVVWQGMSFSVTNTIRWTESYQTFASVTFTDGALVTAETNAVGIAFGQTATLSSAGVMGNATGAKTGGTFTVFRPAFVIPRKTIVGEEALTPIVSVMVFFDRVLEKRSYSIEKGFGVLPELPRGVEIAAIIKKFRFDDSDDGSSGNTRACPVAANIPESPPVLSSLANMPNGIATIQWTDKSTSKSFKRIYTQQDDNKIYEFRWDSESLKWTRGNEGYSITPAVHRNTNIVAFKAEADNIILGCIGQDGSLRLKKFKAYDSGGAKLALEPADSEFASVSATTALAAVDISANGQSHWCMFYQANNNTIQRIDYYDNKWHASTTVVSNAMALTPLAAINTIVPRGTPDALATLILYYRDSGTGFLVISAWVGGDHASWPADSIDTDGWIPGASVVGVPWPPVAGQLGAFKLYLPDASGTMTERLNSFVDLELDTIPSTPSPWDNFYTFSVGAKPMAVFTDLGGDDCDRMVTVHTCSNSGKEIDGFFYHYYTWERTDLIQWDSLTM
ncbi:hypothetical protein GGX14DRAFT_699810 [Mycena pura]|uniref:Fucose-specific lectin n=1 Tax=Mycena pura TaxID=153505 RepID=A0AAD6V155_9AGAR|nr:hypothetical protein GGX14DRAFT_699810 [Mycena pura]